MARVPSPLVDDRGPRPGPQLRRVWRSPAPACRRSLAAAHSAQLLGRASDLQRHVAQLESVTRAWNSLEVLCWVVWRRIVLCVGGWGRK